MPTGRKNMEKLNFNRYAKNELLTTEFENKCCATAWLSAAIKAIGSLRILKNKTELVFCLLYTSDAADD